MDTENFVRLYGPLELATEETSCWKCHKPTPVHALLAADVEEFESGEEPTRVEASTFVYDLSPDSIPLEVKARLVTQAPNYKPTYSRTVGETSWANVCVHCGSLQGAFFLHSEPDGPFFGGPEEFDGKRCQKKGLTSMAQAIGADISLFDEQGALGAWRGNADTFGSMPDCDLGCLWQGA